MVLLSFLGVVAVSPGIWLQSCYGDTFSSAEQATKAVDFINTKYQSGENLDGFTAFGLELAGEDLAADKWTYDNKNLRLRIENLADLLGDSNSLITYITYTQNAGGSFGPYANEYGTKAPLQALAMVKADTVDQAVYDQANSSIALAVSYFKNGYQSGSITYAANGWSFDYRCVEALVATGEDLSSGRWVYGGSTLKDVIVASAGAAAANPLTQDAVNLAKELTVLRAVYPASTNINTLADAIIAKMDTSVAGQVYFGGSIYDDVLVLTALGKAGRLGDIDQDKALTYLNTFKTVHNDSWGNQAGAAWGGFSPEEPDLTAQLLTALSYFNDAHNMGSNVYNSIQEGLAYLYDTQNQDTAAITAQWDSTFATAETLIALKSLGKTYEEYAGATSSWLRKSRTKTVAQCLLAVSNWADDAARCDRLANLLASRQESTGPVKGSFENSVYSDMLAYIALGEANKTSSIDTVSARDYILSKQGADGSWGEVFGGIYYPDMLSTYQAIRALTFLPDASGQQVQDAIAKGLSYLKGLQQADGGVYSSWDDPAIDNSELIVTLYKLNKDPVADYWKNTAGLTPVDYLLNNTMNGDSSFGTAKNVFGATEALSALLLVTGQGGGSAGEGQNPSGQDKCSVSIAVVGMNGELLYGPGGVTVSTNGQWGITALGALDVTGLSYNADQNIGFVNSIGGQDNSGMNGWMFKVNGTVAAVSGKDKQVRAGDRIIWWYSDDINSNGPDWSSLLSGNSVTVSTTTTTSDDLPQGLQPTKEELAALENLHQLLEIKEDTAELGPLGEVDVAVVLVRREKLPGMPEFLAILKELRGNSVDLSQEVEAAKAAVIADKQGEIGLIIPDDALEQNLTITVKEAAAAPTEGYTANRRTQPVAYRQITPVYSLGPDDTHFAVPVTLALRVAIPLLVKPENLALAWYDRDKGSWVAVPAVADIGSGLIMTKINHFSDYAVLARLDRKSFEDIDSDAYSWAVDPVELLAGAGAVDGVDGKHYEPERSITRAELTNILVKTLHLTETTGEPLFKDVSEIEWYAGCIAAAAHSGLVKGYEDGAFCPEGVITREELATVLVRVLDMAVSTDANLPFTDTGGISDWAQDSVKAAVAIGLAKGYPDWTFQPQGTVTRAECATMVYRALTDY